MPHVISMDDSTSDFELPGFRFHPTEEELLDFYLRNMLLGKKLHYDIIGFLNIYHHEPWELPGLAKIGEREWYFFVPRDKRHGSGGRPNRTTKTGFWKATGSDRKIMSSSSNSYPKRVIGLKKTLVFYRGRAPRGCKTDWIMNEYRLPDTVLSAPKDMVLCKIYRKATSLKVLEQRATIEEETMALCHVHGSQSLPTPPVDDAVSACSWSPSDELSVSNTESNQIALKKEADELLGLEKKINPHNSDDNGREDNFCSNINLPKDATNLTELQVPKFTMDWTPDPLWTQLHSPWLEMSWSPFANVMNF